MMLVRYMGLKYGLKTVVSGLFKLLRLLDANDPYEMMGATVDRLSDEAQKELCDDMRYEWAKAPLVVGMRPVRRTAQIEYRVATFKEDEYDYDYLDYSALMRMRRI